MTIVIRNGVTQTSNKVISNAVTIVICNAVTKRIPNFLTL